MTESYQCARVLIQHGLEDRNWKKIEEAAELLGISSYGAVSIQREQKAAEVVEFKPITITTALEDDIELVREACAYADIQAPSCPEAFERIVSELMRLRNLMGQS